VVDDLDHEVAGLCRAEVDEPAGIEDEAEPRAAVVPAGHTDGRRGQLQGPRHEATDDLGERGVVAAHVVVVPGDDVGDVLECLRPLSR
jgi:hypothetical protein